MMTETGQGMKIYQVAEITAVIRRKLEDGIGAICVEGEVSNLRKPTSGHLYFTLKDEMAQIRAVMFRGSQRGMTVNLRDGIRVRAHGVITVYEKSGDYQINIRLLEEAGKGALQEQFERLKKKLGDEGLFDPSRKKKLPLLPRHVGVVTSPSGAAIRDILQVITRRFPNLHVLIVPARVQGAGAAEEIAAGIDWLNQRGGIEVIIVGRGGGSLEDLWCFNEECVARAIARSAIPVISAVGHEIDFTISDFVADLRAPTPSAAAELVVGRKEAFEHRLEELRNNAARVASHFAAALRNRHRLAVNSYALRQPLTRVRSSMQQVDQARLRAAQALRVAAQRARKRLETAKSAPALHEPARMALRVRHLIEGRLMAASGAAVRRIELCRNELERNALSLERSVSLGLERRRARLDQLTARLASVNPYAVIKRGYSMTVNEKGEIIQSYRQVRPDDLLTTRLSDGEVVSVVRESRS